MYVEDYIKRMIAIAAAMIARIIGLKASGEYIQARVIINQLLELIVGLKADLVRRMDDDSLLESLTHQGRMDTDRLGLLAELFRQDGDVLSVQGNHSESIASYLRALNFFLEAYLSGKAYGFPDPNERIRYLLQKLNTQPLPAVTLYSLFHYYEETGSFTQGEEALAKLLAATGLENEVKIEYREYYYRLLEKSDAELEAGGLKRVKIENSLKLLNGEQH
jgi:hypothetical protein